MANNMNSELLEFLIENNHANQEQVDQLAKYSEEYETDILTAIRDSEILGTKDEVIEVVADLNGYDFVKLENIEIDRNAVNLIDQRFAQQQKAIAYASTGDELTVAVPIGKIKDVKLKNDLRRLTKIGVINLVVATTNDILKAIDTSYRSNAELNALNSREKDDQRENDIGDEVGGESEVVRFVDMVLKQAVKDKVSDIHFDPQENELRVRYRMDGILQTMSTVPIFMATEIVSRIKIMAELDISKTREPQDGRISTVLGGRQLDFRVATLPSIFGEKVVMRVLDNSSAKLGLDDLGFSQENLERFRGASYKPYGVLLVTGPTGSGKALAVDTLVATPKGFTEIGEIREGDVVLGGDGKPTKVLSVSELNPHADLYEVTFSDGQKIIADADHQWLVSTRNSRVVPKAKKKDFATSKYMEAHNHATKLTDLSLEFYGDDDFGYRTPKELTALIEKEHLARPYYTTDKVQHALHMADVEGRKAMRSVENGRQTSVIEYPIADALMGLSKRLREKFAVVQSNETATQRMTTIEMLETGLQVSMKNGARNNFAVPVAQPLDLPEADLPIDPYVFGVWLGDGSKEGGCISFGELLAHPDLSNNKTIPEEYMRASYSQRLALLQGIMDTDGHINSAGNSYIDLTDHHLAEKVLQLIRTLGIKASASFDQEGDYKNKDKNKIRKIRHRIRFTTDKPVFSIPRKANLIPSEGSLRSTSNWNYIIDIKGIEAAPALCISVDSPDFTFLVGEGLVVTSNSTTLYAALNELNNPKINIITAEDPVEYQLDGITQVPVRAPLTFEQVLRTVLRADPDVVLIGEIRDRETAEIAMKAGMTGHMVFSTLHTNDAATALTRLGDMGVQQFITASTVEAIVGQRLLRRLCVKCKKRATAPSDADFEAIGFEVNLERDGEPTWYEPVGCKFCGNSGYKGRLAIHEVLLMDSKLEESVIKGAKAFELNRMALEGGMIGLKEDGFRKAAKGLTTIQEVMRVVA